MNAKTKTKDQTVTQAISNLNANGSTLAPELTPLQKLKQQAASKVYVDGDSSNLVGTFEVANIDDPRWARVFDVMTPQGGKLAQGMLALLDDNNQIVIDSKQAAIIEESIKGKSDNNNVLGTYLPLLLGKPWPRNRGNQDMRDVLNDGPTPSFAMFKRIS